MDWASMIHNPLLKDLPFKIELGKWGKILMSPASNTILMKEKSNPAKRLRDEGEKA